MRSRFWTFVEACDETTSTRAVKALLGATLRGMGYETFAILTHGPHDALRSLGVRMHNWPLPAIDHVFSPQQDGQGSVLFETVERAGKPILWGPSHRRNLARREQRWFSQLAALLGGGEAVSAPLRSTVVSASCTVTGPNPIDPDRIRLVVRIADYAYQQALHLQRPRLSEPEKLTTRELELMYRATVLGERPSDVAHQVGVKITTVRTLRQKANVRLDAGSQEQAAWRLIESGQLFRSGRKGRPRTR